MNGDDYLCDGQWDSEIVTAGAQVDNGVFEFTLDPQTGYFIGRHIYPDFQQFAIYGTCRHPGQGGVHRIDIWEIETPVTGYIYYYFGIITPNAMGPGRHRANGRRHRIPKLGPIPEALQRRMDIMAPADDDEWIAIKTT